MRTMTLRSAGRPAPSSGDTRRILLVEDDLGLAYAVQRYLVAAGLEVVSVGDPIEALRELESSRRIDLLVSDVKMPEGLPHGFSLGRMAQIRRPRLPIIFITGYPDVAERDKTPPGLVLTKPIELDRLVAEVLALLEPPARDPAACA